IFLFFIYIFFFFFFFFFQAEDGIRDLIVTGVQTCALPISALGFARGGAKLVLVDRDTEAGEATAGVVRQQGGDVRFVAADVTKRSEERRVGKECRSRWAA